MCTAFTGATVVVEERDLVILEGLTSDVATIFLSLMGTPMLDRTITGSFSTSSIPGLG